MIDDVKDEVINKILVSLCSPGTELYLVGGYIRDLILERLCYDRDYVIKGECAADFAKKAAAFFNGYYVLLDKDFDIARVILPDKKNTLDFAKCFGNDIYEDLKRRDYTVNSISYRIDGLKSSLTDPFNGMGNINKKIIKAVSEKNLIDDPLRLLRGFRLAAQLNFQIENSTINFINKHKLLIHNVSIERINTELIKLFESGHAASNLILMKNIEFLDEILPEMTSQRKIPPNLHHHLSLIDHSIETVRQIEINISNMPQWVQERLNQEPAINIKLISLLKIAGLLHDIGKPSTWQIDEQGRHRFIKHEEVGAEIAVNILKHLKFSKNSIKYITKLIKYHIYPSQVLKSDEGVTEKAVFRMFRRIGEEFPEVIILAISDRLSARGPEISEEIVNNNIKGLYRLLEKYTEWLKKEEVLPKLISGTEIMEILNIPESPQVGRILKTIKEAQIAGDITTREEALDFIKKFD